MKEKVEVLSASDLKPVFDELDAVKTMASALSENCQPIFQGKRYLTDSTLSRRQDYAQGAKSKESRKSLIFRILLLIAFACRGPTWSCKSESP